MKEELLHELERRRESGLGEYDRQSEELRGKRPLTREAIVASFSWVLLGTGRQNADALFGRASRGCELLARCDL